MDKVKLEECENLVMRFELIQLNVATGLYKRPAMDVGKEARRQQCGSTQNGIVLALGFVRGLSSLLISPFGGYPKANLKIRPGGGLIY